MNIHKRLNPYNTFFTVPRLNLASIDEIGGKGIYYPLGI